MSKWAVINKSTGEVVETYPSRSKARENRGDDQRVAPAARASTNASQTDNATSVSVGSKTDGSTSVETGARRETKIDRAREIVAASTSRKEALASMQESLGMSKAMANTYYYKVK